MSIQSISSSSVLLLVVFHVCLALGYPSFPNGISQVGQGVNSLFASMDGSLSCGGCQIPGLVQPVFEMSSWSNQRTFGNDIALPDGWSYVPAEACNFFDEAVIIHDWYDYQTNVYAYETTTHSFLFWHWSRTDWFDAITQGTFNGESVYIRHEVSCTSYQVSRNALDYSAVLTEEFVSQISLLPSDVSQYNASLQTLLDTVTRFGDSVILTATFGGKAAGLTQFTTESYQSIRKEGGDLNDIAALNSLCKLGDEALCNPSNPNWNSYLAFNSSIVSEQFSYIPFVPPADPQLGFGGFLWAAEVEGTSSGIISFELSPITDLLSEGFFPNDENITAKASLLQYFLQNDYCSLVSGGCPAPPVPRARYDSTLQGLPFPSGALTAAFAPSFETHNLNSTAGSFFIFGGTSDASGVLDVELPSLRWDENLGQFMIFSPPSILFSAQALAYAASTAFDGGLMLIGGGYQTSSGSSISASSDVAYFDSLRWHGVGPLASPRYMHCAVTVNIPIGSAGTHFKEYVLVFGGMDSNGNIVSSTEKFVEELNSWEPKTSMPDPRYGMTCTVVDDYMVYFVGGADALGAAGSVLLYNAKTDEWVASNIPPMDASDFPRYGHAAAYAFGKIFVFGGQVSSSDNPMNDVRILQLPSAEVAAEWAPGCPMPFNFSFGGAVALTNPVMQSAEIHLFGGFSQSGGQSPVSNHVALQLMSPSTSITCDPNSLLIDFKSLQDKPFTVFEKMHLIPEAEQVVTPPKVLRSMNSVPQVLQDVSYIGQGFSTPHGALTSQPLFEPLCSTCFQDNSTFTGFSFPDFVHFNSLQQCSYTAFSDQILDELDLQASLSAFARVDASLGVPILFNFGFTASALFDSTSEAMATDQTTYIHTTAQCTGFQLQYSPLGSSSTPPLSSHFVEAVMALPDPSSEGYSLEPYLTLLSVFGDHYVSGLQHGSRATQVFQISSSNYSASLSAHLDAAASARSSFLIFFGSSHTSGAAVDVEADAELTKFVSTNQTYCVPLCPPHVDNVATNSGPWAAGVLDAPFENGTAYSYSIRPITDLFDDILYTNYPANSSDHLSSVKAIITEIIVNGTYCDSVLSCSSASRLPRWITTSTLPAPVYEAAGHVDAKGNYYLLGGQVDGQAVPYTLLGSYKRRALNHTSSNSMLHADDNGGEDSDGDRVWQWRWAAALPDARFNMTTVLVKGLLYAIGGIDKDGAMSSRVDVMNVSSNIWFEGPSLPYPLSGASSAVVGDMIVLIGGEMPSSTINSVAWWLNASEPNASWGQGGHSIPQSGVIQPGVATLNGTVYAFGGTFQDGMCSQYLLTYEVLTDTWEANSKLPYPSCTIKVVEMEGLFVYFEGSGLTSVFSFDPTTGEYSILPSNPISSPGSIPLVHPNSPHIHMIGGSAPTRTLKYPLSALKPTPAPPSSIHLAEPLKSTRLSTKLSSQDQDEKMKSSSSNSIQNSGAPFPYLATLGHGYNTILGDPFGPSGVDPGWAPQPVFNMMNFTSFPNSFNVPEDPYTWLLPENVFGDPASTEDCSYTQWAVSLGDAYSYVHAATGLFGPLPSSKWGWPSFFGYEFSTSSAWSTLLKAQVEMNGTLQISVGYCKRYLLNVMGDEIPGPFTNQFVEDLRALPTEVDGSSVSQFTEFVSKYGLYMPTQLSLGSLISQVSILGDAAVGAMARSGFSLTGAAKASLLLFFGGDASAVVQGEGAGAVLFEYAISDNYTVCAPQCPPSQPDVMNNQSGWVQQLVLPSGSVSPVSSSLTPLVDVIESGEAFLPSDLQGAALQARLAALSQYVQGYACYSTPGCSFLPSTPLTSWQIPSYPEQLPVAVAGAVGLVSDSAYFVIGGQTDTDFSTAQPLVQIYDLSLPSPSWVSRYNLTTARTGAAGAIARGSFFVCGGYADVDDKTVLNTCETSSLGTGPWSLVAANMTTPRAFFAFQPLTLANGSVVLYAFGGESAPGVFLDTVEMFVTDGPSAQWTLLNTFIPTPLSYIFSCVFANSIYVFTGNNISVFDGASLQPSNMQLPFPVFGGNAVVAGEAIFISGGVSALGNNPTSAALLFDPVHSSIALAREAQWTMYNAAQLFLSSNTTLYMGGFTVDTSTITQNITSIVTISP